MNLGRDRDRLGNIDFTVIVLTFFYIYQPHFTVTVGLCTSIIAFQRIFDGNMRKEMREIQTF